MEPTSKGFGNESYAELNLFCFGRRWCSLHEMLAWAEYVGRLTHTLEHLQQTEESLQTGFDMDQDRLKQAVNDFRYRNNLITSVETQQWLKERALSLDDLYTWVHRQFCDRRRHLMLTIPAWKKRCNDCAHEVWAELHFNGKFQILLDEFVHRIAVSHKNGIARPEPSLEDLSSGPQLEHVFLTDDMKHVAELERMYQEYAEEIADRDSCQRRLNLERMNLLKVKYEAVSYRDINAAKEAYCCMKFDGETPDSLASRTHAPYETEYSYIEDIPDPLQQHLLSAGATECLEPIRITPQKGYTVYSVMRKTEPHLNNHEVRSRLQKKIVADNLAPLIDKEVQWLPWQPGVEP